MRDQSTDPKNIWANADSRARDTAVIVAASGTVLFRPASTRPDATDQLAPFWFGQVLSGSLAGLPLDAGAVPWYVGAADAAHRALLADTSVTTAEVTVSHMGGTVSATQAVPDSDTPPKPIASRLADPAEATANFHFMAHVASASSATSGASGADAITAGASGPGFAAASADLPITSDSSAPLSSAELTTLANSLGTLFTTLTGALTSKVFDEALPILGSALGSASGTALAALQEFQNFSAAILNALQTLEGTPGQTVQTVVDALNAAIAPYGGSAVPGTDASGNPTITFSETETSSPFSIGVGSNFGIPGLGLKIPGGGAATATIGYNFTQTVTLMPDGSIVDATGTAPLLTANLTVKTPAVGGDVDLGFLKFSAKDNGSSLSGTFSLDESGDVTLQGAANINVALSSDLGPSADFPSISADLVGSWNFGSGASSSTLDPSNPQSLGVAAPSIGLTNVQYDFGSFVDSFIEPVFKEIDSVVAPIQPALDVLNFDLTPYFTSLLGSSAISSLDTTGAWSFITNSPTSDGKITLLDLLNQAHMIDPSVQPNPLVEFVSIINTIQNFEKDVGPIATGTSQFTLGNFALPAGADIRSPSFNIQSIVPTVTGTQDINSFLNGIEPAGSQALSDLQGVLRGGSDGGAASTSDGIQISSPLIDNPTLAAEMLFGVLGDTPTDLFTADLTPPTVGIGDFSTNPPTNTRIVTIPGISLGPIGGINGFVDASFGLKFGIDLGLDTTGLQEYAASNFNAPGDLLDGLYIANPVVAGAEQPVLSVGADFEPGLELDAGPLSISGGADIYGSLGVSLAQSGKNYVVPLINKIGTSAISQIFAASGAVTAGLDFSISAGPLNYSDSPVRVTLVDFNTGSASSGNSPTVATVWGAARTEAATTGTNEPVIIAPPAPGSFDTEDGWQSPGYSTSGDGEVKFYGASTITPGANVDFVNPTGFVDLTSLTIQHGATLDDNGPWMFIEGALLDPANPPGDSLNLGTLAIDDGTLALNGSLANAGSVALGFVPGVAGPGDNAEVVIGGPVRLYGGGRVTGAGGVTFEPFGQFLPIDSSATYPYIDLQQITPSDIVTLFSTARLINDDNTIDGSMTFGAPVTNAGTIDADSAANPIVFISFGTDMNTGLLEASHHYVDSFFHSPDQFGKLEIDDNTVNYGGTILAAEGGTVTIGGFTSIAVHGGLLEATPYDLGLDAGQTAPVSAIETSGTVMFDGGPTIVTGQSGTLLYAGLNIAGTVDVHGTLIVTGLIDSTPAVQAPGAGYVVAAAPTDLIELDNALLEGGEYDAVAVGTADPGTIEVVQTTTIDSSLTAPDVAFGGRVQIGPATTLTIGGEISTNVTSQARLIVNFGTVVVGLPEKKLLTGATIDIKDTATLAAQYPLGLLSTTYVQGDLKLVDGSTNLVTGFDAASVLQNDWTIEGAGALGGGTLQIVNVAPATATSGVGIFTVPGGTIDANGMNSLVINSGARGAINQSLMEATNGGELDIASNVNNAGGTIEASVGVVFIDSATIAGGLLTEAAIGLVSAGGHSGLDGRFSPLTLASGLTLTSGPGGTLSLAGAIVNHGTVLLQGGTSAAAVGAVGAYAVLSGGGVVSLADPAPSLGTGHAVLGGGALSLQNVDNLITGTGVLSTGAENDAAGVIASGAGLLSITGGILNTGSIEAPAGTLAISGVITNLTGVIAANGGQVLLSGGTVVNEGVAILLSAILVSGSGTIEASNAGGNSGTVVVAGVVKGGVLSTSTSDPNSLIRAGASGGVLDGGAYGVTLTAGSHLLVGASSTLTLDGSIDNASTIAVVGNPGTADLQISGATTLGGGGAIALSDALSTGNATTQIISGTNTASLDNIDNTVSGAGKFGNALVSIINEAAGSILSGNGTLIVQGGAGGLINRGRISALTGSELILGGNVFDAGDTLGADGGTLDLRGAIAGGAFETSGDGQIWLDSGVLDGRASAVTIPAGVTIAELASLPAPGVNISGLEGTLNNLGELLLQSDSSKAGNQRSILLAGTVDLTGGGLVSMSDLSATGSAAEDSVLGSTGADVLDNVDNRIVGWGTIGGSGNTALTLKNETAGTVDAADGQLFLRVFGTGNTSSNRGLIEAVGGTLDLSGTINNVGGTIASSDDSVAHPGTVLIDGFTIRGGLLTSDTADAASRLMTTSNNGTLDGTANAVTLAALGHVQVASGSSLTVTGTLVDQGVITATGSQVVGSGYVLTYPADVVVAGTATVRGAGAIVLSDGTGLGNDTNQIIAGKSSADTLDTAGVISGVGLLGNHYYLTLINETGGTVSASGGTLLADTGTVAIANTGLLTAAPTGTLDLRSNVHNTGGTIAATGSGLTVLDNMTVTGGGFIGSAGGLVIGQYATIDGIASAVTLAAGAQVGVLPTTNYYNNNVLTLTGNFTNDGTLFARSNPAIPDGDPRYLLVAGSVRLTGGGLVAMQDASASPGFGSTYFYGSSYGAAPNTYASNTLDNVDNIISGQGVLGNPDLAITNEAAGTIAATGGALSIITASSNSIPTQGRLVNAGTVEALGGSLLFNGVVDNRGGVVQAVRDGAGHSGTVELYSVSFLGGTFLSDPADPASVIVSGNGTLDGTAGAVTLGAGSPVRVPSSSSLDLTGSIVNLGTLVIAAIGGYGSTLGIIGTARLSGGGRVSMSDAALALDDRLYGMTGADTLDNVDNTIIGLGHFGLEQTSVTNEAAGVIAAQGGTLLFDPTGPGTMVANRGLLEALGGTLDVRGSVVNTGGTIAARNDGAGHSGIVLLTGDDIIGGVLAGDTTDSQSLFEQTGNGSTLDGSSGAITLTSSATLQNGTGSQGGTVHLRGTVAVQGAIVLDSNQYYGNAVLQIDGAVSLGGGGTIAFSPGGASGDQLITGTTSNDTLDNTGVSITGFGQIGNRTNNTVFINEAAGVVSAIGGTLAIATGSTAVTNRGILGAAAGGVLDLLSNIADAGGTIGGGGTVLLDGDLVTGGIFAGTVLSYGGTVDGRASAVTVAAGATLGTSASFPNNYAKSMTVEGTVVNHGTLFVQGSDTASNVPGVMIVSGVVSLGGGGQLVLTGLGPKDHGSQTLVEATVATDTLDNVDNLITGFGTLGAHGLSIIDEAHGTIRAQGGLLDLPGAVTGAGTLAIADQATLELDGTVAAGLTLDFLTSGSHQTLELGKPLATTAVIDDFLAGDSITFSGSYSTVVPSFSGGTLDVIGNGATVATLLLAGAYTPANVSVTSKGGTVTVTTTVACFATGTRILTATGERDVEKLRIGDMVPDIVARRLRRVVWIGRKTVDCRAHLRPADVLPVRVRRDAFGPGMPHRDLVLSPDHSLYRGAALVPVRRLVDGRRIVQEHADAVTYWHVELDRHGVLLAEGMPAESYLDCGDRSAFVDDARPEVTLFAAARREARACALLRSPAAPTRNARWWRS